MTRQKRLQKKLNTPLVPETFHARVSGFCQIFIVTRAKSKFFFFTVCVFGLQVSTCGPNISAAVDRHYSEYHKWDKTAITLTSHFHRDVGLGKQGGHGGVPLHSKGILIFGHRILYFYVRAWDLHVHGPCVLSKQTILVGRGEAQGTSIFSTQRSFLTNRAPSISIYKETGLQTFQRCKDTWRTITFLGD